MCEMQYMLEYVLGWKSPSGFAADKGTIVHKIMEILACIKHAEQKKEKFVDDDIVGKLDIKNYNLDDIIKKVFVYYSTMSPLHKWTEKELKLCSDWTYKALQDNNGTFDPRVREIIQPEQHFDIVIDKPWSHYKYETPEGVLEGQLAIKGTIDLITKVNDNTLELIDYKTGKRLDWATGEEKTLAKLYKDPQLKIYHYAISKLFPEYDHIIASINYINDGGTYSVCFDKSDLADTEDMIRAKFEKIKNTNKPRLNKSWKCTKLCHFGKSTFENTSLLPILEYRDGQVCKPGQVMTKCEQVKHEIDLIGMKGVVDSMTCPGYTIGKYKAPGAIE
jgi:CRISPR/Cas system-associated exonuclease Cas4 (RecB family)